jgi:hypothetical protein
MFRKTKTDPPALGLGAFTEPIQDDPYEDTYAGMTERINSLVAERDRLLAENARLEAGYKPWYELAVTERDLAIEERTAWRTNAEKTRGLLRDTLAERDAKDNRIRDLMGDHLKIAAERNRLIQALEEASLRQCERMYGTRLTGPTCRSPLADEHRDRDSWCASCIAREALAKTTEEDGVK